MIVGSKISLNITYQFDFGNIKMVYIFKNDSMYVKK